MRKVNLGCGPYPQKGYINVDINPRQKPDIVRDVRRGMPFDTDSVDEVIANHFIEHLESEDILDLFEEVYRVLKPGGKFGFIVPLGLTGELDHVSCFTEYSFDMMIRSDKDGDAALYFNRHFFWREASKRTFPQSNRTSLHMILEAVK